MHRCDPPRRASQPACAADPASGRRRSDRAGRMGPWHCPCESTGTSTARIPMCACEQTHSAEAAMLINSRSYHDHPLRRVRRDYGGSSMPVDARDVATDLNRMDDDGGRLRHPVLTSTLRLAPGPATARQQRTDANHPATSVNATHDWYRQLGASHRRRDESVRLSALAMQQRDQAQQLACDRRWPAVVEAMRAL